MTLPLHLPRRLYIPGPPAQPRLPDDTGAATAAPRAKDRDPPMTAVVRLAVVAFTVLAVVVPVRVGELLVAYVAAAFEPVRQVDAAWAVVMKLPSVVRRLLFSA